MGTVTRYGPLTFEDDFGRARRDDGSVLIFTRAERKLLRDLALNAGRLRTRQQLLDAVAAPHSDTGDRNVDYLVTRLRAKLGDPAKKPWYIGTRYGEGYMWIAEASPVPEGVDSLFIVIEPAMVIGDAIGAEDALTYCQRIVASLREELPPTLSIRDRERDGLRSLVARFSLSFTFIRAGNRRECISTTREGLNGRIVYARRDDCDAADSGEIASGLVAALWREQVGQTGPGHPATAPVSVRMVEAGSVFSVDTNDSAHAEIASLKGEAFPSAVIWRKNETYLRTLLREHRADPSVRLMLATNIHTRYVIDGWRFLATEDPREKDQAELRSLLLDILPVLMDDPQHALAAAHVLSFMDQGHQVLALQIAEEAFRRSTALADALSVLGRLRCFAGNFEGGLGLLYRARTLVQPGSVFERYVTSCICQGLLASGDFAEKARELETLTRSPVSKGPYRLMYADPHEREPSLPVRIHLALSPRRYARAAILWSYYTSARCFQTSDARENVILGLARHMRRRFGDEIIPEEVAQAIPAVLESHDVQPFRDRHAWP